MIPLCSDPIPRRVERATYFGERTTGRIIHEPEYFSCCCCCCAVLPLVDAYMRVVYVIQLQCTPFEHRLSYYPREISSVKTQLACVRARLLELALSHKGLLSFYTLVFRSDPTIYFFFLLLIRHIKSCMLHLTFFPFFFILLCLLNEFLLWQDNANQDLQVGFPSDAF